MPNLGLDTLTLLQKEHMSQSTKKARIVAVHRTSGYICEVGGKYYSSSWDADLPRTPEILVPVVSLESVLSKGVYNKIMVEVPEDVMEENNGVKMKSFIKKLREVAWKSQ